MRLAKPQSDYIFIVGHVTKEGTCWASYVGTYGGYRSVFLKGINIWISAMLRSVKTVSRSATKLASSKCTPEDSTK